MSENKEMRTFDKILIILLCFYIPLIILAGLIGVYSHFYGGILVVAVILFKSRIINLMDGSGYKGYILFVVVFDVIWETLFYIGGFELLPVSYLEIILINLIFWFTMGTTFYFLAERFEYNPIKALIIPAILGILIENILRLGEYSLEVSLGLMLVNGLNYSIELGFAYWFVKGDTDRKAHVLYYILGIIILYMIFWALYFIFSSIYYTEIEISKIIKVWEDFLK